MSRTRVLHAPSEIAGQPSILARALRDLGVEAWSLATNPTFAAYHPDESPGYDDMPPLPRYAGYAGLVAKHLLRHDVFHFHFGRTLIPPHNLDLPLYRALGKKLVFHFHGCDVRNRAHMLATHAARPPASTRRTAPGGRSAAGQTSTRWGAVSVTVCPAGSPAAPPTPARRRCPSRRR